MTARVALALKLTLMGVTPEEKREEPGLSTAQFVLQKEPAASRLAVGLLLVMHGSPQQQLVATLTVEMPEAHLVRPQCLLARL